MKTILMLMLCMVAMFTIPGYANDPPGLDQSDRIEYCIAEDQVNVQNECYSFEIQSFYAYNWHETLEKAEVDIKASRSAKVDSFKTNKTVNVPAKYTYVLRC